MMQCSKSSIWGIGLKQLKLAELTRLLNLFILMDYPMDVNTIKYGIVHFVF